MAQVHGWLRTSSSNVAMYRAQVMDAAAASSGSVGDLWSLKGDGLSAQSRTVACQLLIKRFCQCLQKHMQDGV